MLLNDGKCPQTGHQILRPETVTEMFRNQIPHMPEYARQGIPAAKQDLVEQVIELWEVPGNPPQGWGLTFMLAGGGTTGRSPSTAHWAGLPNCWWWCDREKGVAGMVCAQTMPHGDVKVSNLRDDVEREIYNALG